MDPYEWDEAKYATNLRKHHVGLELVRNFDWESAAFAIDERFEYGEERVRAFGRVDGDRIASFTPGAA